jgi:hypothetical protein
MYKTIKSCVDVKSKLTDFFLCNTGVRQGENLSPTLFAIYLNDIEAFLSQNNCNDLTFCSDDDDVFIDVHLKLFLLLYADDTVLFADNKLDLQNNLDAFSEYCKLWRLTVNISKTKVVIFGGSKKDYKCCFTVNNEPIENAVDYKYLGVIFHKRKTFTSSRQYNIDQATKAMFFILKRGKHLNLSLQCQLRLFDSMVVPILLYGCEIWSFENIQSIEKIHIKFLRQLLPLRKSTPLYIIYGELGRFPLDVLVKTRTISFWSKLLYGKSAKMSTLIYKLLYNNYAVHKLDVKWLLNVKHILDQIGMSHLFTCQHIPNIKGLSNIVHTILKDQNIQKWSSDLTLSNKGKSYSLFKDSLNYELYLDILQPKIYRNILLFRTSNHSLPIETGRWQNIPHHERICRLCNLHDICDEFHCILKCPSFNEHRYTLIPKYYYTRPNILKFRELFNTKKASQLRKLSAFCKIINDTFKK